MFAALAAAALLAGPPAMTLPEALAFAREHQPALESARARVEAAVSESGIPRAAWLPRLSATAQAFEATANNTTASYIGAPGVDVPRIGGTRTAPTGSWSPSPSTLAGLGVRQEVFDFGRTAALTAAADALVDAEQQHARAVSLDVTAAVEEGFVAVRAAHAVVEAAEAAVRRAQAHRDLASAGVTSGLRRPIELTRAEADLARARLGAVRAQGGLASAQALFAAAVGAPGPALDTRGDAPPPRTTPDLEVSIARASASDPVLLQLDAQVRAQRARTRSISAELRPDLSLTAGLTGRAGGATPTAGEVPSGGGWLPVVPNWHVGMLLSWPIFDGGVLSRRSASAAREQAASAEFESARQRLAASVQQAILSLEIAREALPALQAAARAASDNQAQADARFKAGLGTAVELADAEALLTDAQIQLAVGNFDLSRASARLDRVLPEAP
jgi:outer membrane protein TolC